MIGWKLKALGAVSLIAVASATGWYVYHLKTELEEAKGAEKAARARLTESERNRAIEGALSDGYALVDRIYTERLKDAQDEINELRSAVAAGSVELRVVAAECRDSVPEDTGSSGVGDPGSPRLKREFEPAYYAHREGIERNEQALRACIAAYETLKGQVKNTPP